MKRAKGPWRAVDLAYRLREPVTAIARALRVLVGQHLVVAEGDAWTRAKGCRPPYPALTPLAKRVLLCLNGSATQEAAFQAGPQPRRQRRLVRAEAEAGHLQGAGPRTSGCAVTRRQSWGWGWSKIVQYIEPYPYLPGAVIGLGVPAGVPESGNFPITVDALFAFQFCTHYWRAIAELWGVTT